MSTDGEAQVSLGNGAPGVVPSGIKDNHHITALEMEDDEHPGIMDQEIEGVGDDGHDEQMDGEQDSHLDVPPSETKADDDHVNTSGCCILSNFNGM